MGNSCAAVCGCCKCCDHRSHDGYAPIEGRNTFGGVTESAPQTGFLFSRTGTKDELPSKYHWEQKTLEDNVFKSGKVTHAAIVSFKDGELRAATPRDFRPHPRAIKNILAALNGDTSGIADDGINFGGGTPVSTPGKLDAGKAIYAADGQGGGCTIFKTKECVLIVVYDKEPALATRLASEVAEYMEEDNNK